MGDEMLRSRPAPNGHRSPRRYTRAEVAAARRIGLARGKEKHDHLGGPIFWAGGDYYPDQVRQGAADYALVLAAMEREWAATNPIPGGGAAPNPFDSGPAVSVMESGKVEVDRAAVELAVVWGEAWEEETLHAGPKFAQFEVDALNRLRAALEQERGEG